MILETSTIGLILGIISCTLLLLVYLVVFSRKASQNSCTPSKSMSSNSENVWHQTMASTPRTSYETYPFNKLNTNEGISNTLQDQNIIQSNEEYLKEHFEERFDHEFNNRFLAFSSNFSSQKHVIYKGSINDNI